MSFNTQQQLQAIVGEQELFEFEFGPGNIEYYTSGSSNVVLPAGHALNPGSEDIEYIAAPITRDTVKDQTKLLGKRTRLVVPLKTSSFQDVLLTGGLNNVKIKIIRGFGDPVTSFANYVRYWYTGVLQDLQTGSMVLIATFKSMEYLFDVVQIPRIIVSRGCNHDVYDEFCSLVESTRTYEFTVNEVLENFTKFRVTPDDPLASGFDFADDSTQDPVQIGRFTLGKVWREDDTSPVKHMILAQEWSSPDSFCYIYTHTPLVTVTATSPDNRLLMSWGCAKRIKEDCIDKFNNKQQALGIPTLPNQSPVLTQTFNK